MSGTDHPPSTNGPARSTSARRALWSSVAAVAAVVGPISIASATDGPDAAGAAEPPATHRSTQESQPMRAQADGFPVLADIETLAEAVAPPTTAAAHRPPRAAPATTPPPPPPPPPPPAVAARRHGLRLQRPEQPRRLGPPRPVRVRRQLGRQHRQRLLRRHPVLPELVAGRRRHRLPRTRPAARPRSPWASASGTRAAGPTGPPAAASSATADQRLCGSVRHAGNPHRRRALVGTVTVRDHVAPRPCAGRPARRAQGARRARGHRAADVARRVLERGGAARAADVVARAADDRVGRARAPRPHRRRPPAHPRRADRRAATSRPPSTTPSARPTPPPTLRAERAALERYR